LKPRKAYGAVKIVFKPEPTVQRTILRTDEEDANFWDREYDNWNWRVHERALAQEDSPARRS
jgi:hypothetical protein